MPDTGLLVQKIKRFFLLFLLAAGLADGAEISSIPYRVVNSHGYVSLSELKTALPLSTSWDIITGRGRIFFKQHNAVFLADSSLYIIDETVYYAPWPVLRIGGDIHVPLPMAQAISETMHGKILQVSGNRVRIMDSDTGILRPPGPPRFEPITFIVIDPGHGGRDPGAVGANKLKEKDITMKVSRLLADDLRHHLKGVKILLTRDHDRFDTLARRTEMANRLLKKNENGIFISVHVNASISTKISGFETYYLSHNATNEDARKTAALENNVIILEDNSTRKKYGDIEFIEAIMITTQIQKESKLLAEEVQSGMDANITRFKSRGVRTADFYVLRGVLMPAVLVEIGFISHKIEARYLTDTEHQERIVRGISLGVRNFLAKYNVMIRQP